MSETKGSPQNEGTEEKGDQFGGSVSECILLQQNKRYDLPENAELRIKGRSDRKEVDYKDQRTSQAWKGSAFFWIKRENLISLNVIKNTARRLL